MLCEVFFICLSTSQTGMNSSQAKFVEIRSETVIDKIRGGLLGEILGDLNGLTHEMNILKSPGRLPITFLLSLPGAWTDDDTDFEWVYLYLMQHSNTILYTL